MPCVKLIGSNITEMDCKLSGKIPKEKLSIANAAYRTDCMPSSLTITTIIDGVLTYQKYFADKRERGEYKK